MWVPERIEVDKPVSEYLREWAKLTPQRIAIRFYGRDIAYIELDELIDRVAWGLLGLGLKKGDRVAVHMENCPQFVAAYFGVQRAGGVVVPVNPMFKQSELDHELNDAEAETLIGQDFLYSEVEKIRHKTSLKHVILTSLKDYLPKEPSLPLPPGADAENIRFPETLDFQSFLEKSQARPFGKVGDMKTEPAVLQYTGGTTGIPKGAMISHYALSCASVGAARWYHHRENDVHLAVAPLFHIMAQQQSMCTPLVSGGCIVILSRFIPDVVARAVQYYGCTSWVAATTMIIALLSLPDNNNYDFSSLRNLVTGGAPISNALQRQLSDRIPDAIVGEGWGMSETLPQGGATTPFFRHKPGFVGIPQLNDIKIMDLETGTHEMPPNVEGEILVKGPTVMLGYWKNPEETKAVFRDGWLCTGDIGLMDEDGYIKLLGRKRELIKCSGFSVFPAEVEDLLYHHPAVKEAAVIGVSDDYRGETPKAFIVLKPEYASKISEEEIINWCKENMAAYKRPHFIEFRQELPKSGAGKLLKRLLV
jgi:acyl-CoA synthetase (AMP-forming)/AMP-acid ligase II